MLVLAYHSVRDGHPRNPFVTGPEEFEFQLRSISKRYRFLDPRDLDPAGFPEDGAVLTFDDGYEDNYSVAYPIARKLGIPMAVFLATKFIGGRMRLGGEDLPCLTAEQIREMGASGLVRFGSHTHGHIMVDEVQDRDAFAQDLMESRRIIAGLLGAPPSLFVYPKNRYNPLHRPVLEKSFRIAFRGGGIAYAGCDPLQVPRVEFLNGDGRLKRFLKVTGAYYGLRNLRGKIALSAGHSKGGRDA